ncbi:VCBS repeat-containing protein [Streptomyces sp. NPDC089799]|uniref:FG-GAP repeat domain-containing protein n=1 Tax=Streptomyces sp. NPDC089799 TaxID=3155066 RepID=UPI00344A167E
MSSTRHKRLGRVAACTALALSAGTLLSAGPAFAAGEPAAPKPSVSSSHAGTLTLKHPAKPGAFSSSPGKTTYAAKAAKPRLDLDGDGWSDLLFRNVWGGSATLGTELNSVAGYRINGDDKETVRDIVALGNIRGGWGTEVLQWSFDGRLSMHQAYEAGTQAPSWAGYGWQVYNKLIAVGDLTRDGRGDLLARTPSGDLYLYRATGSATGEPFAGRVKVGGGWGAYDQIIGSNDVDADGIADLLAKDLNGNLYYYKGTGSATSPFKARTWVGGGWNTYNKILAADDQTGDGKADLFGVQPNGDLFFYASLGNGKFTARQNAGSGWRGEDLMVNSGVTPNYGKHAVRGVDSSNTVWEHANRTDGRFYDERGSFQAPAPAGATLVDAAGVAKYNWSARYFWNGSTLSLPTGAAIAGNFANTNLVVGPGDLTGDGKGDLLTRDTSGTLWLRPGNGTGTWFGNPVKVGAGWNAYKSIVGGGDINGDGRADLVAQSGDGHLYVYKGTGNTSAPFAARDWAGGGWNGYTGIAVSGDLTGDGRADLVARDSGGTMWLYRSQGWGGTHTFAARTWLSQGWNTYTQFN